MKKSVNEHTSDGKTVYRAPRDGVRPGLHRRAAHARSSVRPAQSAGAEGSSRADGAAGAQGGTSAARARQNAVALLGAAVLLLIAAGITAAVIFGVRAVSGSSKVQAQAEKERLEQLISPLAMCGVEPFDDVSALDSETLARICVWSSLVTRSDEPDTDESGRILLPSATVSATCESLFGSAAHFTPVSFYDGGVYFEYDVVHDTYHIPVTGIEGGYTPRITDIRKEKGGKVLTVDYYEEDYSGAAHKAKTMIYVLSGADGSERIASVSAAG